MKQICPVIVVSVVEDLTQEKCPSYFNRNKISLEHISTCKGHSKPSKLNLNLIFKR